MFSIKAKKRDESVKLENLRKEGEMPAVFYGAGKKNTPISISVNEFKKMWRDAGETSTVKIMVGNESVDALIHDVQLHPVTDEPLHADFLAVDMNKKIKVNIALDFEGVSDAVKNGLGNLVKVLHEVEVEALPNDLPHSLTVDISKLAKLDDQIFVSDLKIPAGVTIITPGQEVVASVVKQVEEKEEEAAPVDLSSIEVEKKGKKEEEGTGESTAEEQK